MVGDRHLNSRDLFQHMVPYCKPIGFVVVIWHRHMPGVLAANAARRGRPRAEPRRPAATEATHRAEVGVEAVAEVADGAHQLRHDLLEPLRVHAPPFLALRRNSFPGNGVRYLITSLDEEARGCLATTVLRHSSGAKLSVNDPFLDLRICLAKLEPS